MFSYKFTHSCTHIQTNPVRFYVVLYYLSLVARVFFVKVVVEADGKRPSQGGGIVFARADWMANWINRFCTPAHALNRMKLFYYGSIPSYTRLVFFSFVPNSLTPLSLSVDPSHFFFFAIARFVSFRYLHITRTI